MAPLLSEPFDRAAAELDSAASEPEELPESQAANANAAIAATGIIFQKGFISILAP